MLLRSSRFLAQRTNPSLSLRHASTTSQATQAATNTATKAKDSASNITSKASEGLSKVSSSAGPAVAGAARGVGNAVSRMGGRGARLVGFVESMVPPAIYYSRVGLELSKLVFQAQKMSPPSTAAFRTYADPIVSRLRDPRKIFSTMTETAGNTANNAASMSPETMLSRIRNLDGKKMVGGAVIVAEVLGFFTIGEIIGRRKIVGYRGGQGAHETATPH
ncbi:hypothetical protein MMC25_003295 [Agyrium rufum]|nr:hypothetical protein [Agyrium rufum]